MKPEVREDIALITLSGQLLLESEHRCAELEAERDALKQALQALQEQAKIDQDMAAHHQREEQARRQTEWDQERAGAIAQCALKDGHITRLEHDVQRERLEKAQLLASFNALSASLEAPSDLGEIKVNFERGQDGKIKSPLRIN